MLCERCNEPVREPEALMGSSWLYRCACGKTEIRPAQQARGSRVIDGVARGYLAVSGTIEVQS